MLIAVMSDIHDRWDNLEKAVEIANARGAEELLFAGDFMSPPGMKLMRNFGGKVTMVWGNNDGEKIGLMSQAKEGNFLMAGDLLESEIAGKKIHMQHYPRAGEIAFASNLYEIVIYGHTHEWREEKANGKLLLNPGEIQGYGTGIASFALVETDTLEVEKIIINNS